MEFHWNERRGWKAKLPLLNTKAPAAAITLHDNSFAMSGARLWNTLPKNVNQQKTLEPFKMALGKFLDNIPDLPPVKGYVCVNDNSIIKCLQNMK